MLAGAEFELLVRHFFGRFFDTESLSPQGKPEAGVVQTLGILAVPSAFLAILMMPVNLTGWNMIMLRFMVLSLPMLVMGFVMVFEWDSLFPDRRDYQILTTLPIRLSTLFLAKAAALALFLGLFLVDVNFFSVLFWPGVSSLPDLNGNGSILSIMGTHFIVVFGSGLFATLFMAALRGVLLTVLPGSLFRRVSVPVQTVVMGMLVMLFFVTPLLGSSAKQLVRMHHPIIYWYPGFWFAGLYERFRPVTRDPLLLELGSYAIRGLWCAAGVFLLTYLPLYRRHARRMLETPEPSRSGPGRVRLVANAWLDRVLLRKPVEQAVFRFIGETITRSVKDRLFLATYGGFGVAVAVLTLGSGPDGWLRLPLSLSFVLVSALRAAFNFPSELRANWAFQITETTHIGEYVAATRKWLVVCAILPLFALLAIMEFTRFPAGAALFHLAYGIALSLLLMEILFFGFRKVPFTCAHFPGKVNLVGLSVVYILGFTTYSRSMATVEGWLYGWPRAAVIFFTFVAAGCVVLNRLGARPAEGATSLDYEDRGDPLIRTLDLNVQ
jgi:hypothetical protein